MTQTAARAESANQNNNEVLTDLLEGLQRRMNSRLEKDNHPAGAATSETLSHALQPLQIEKICGFWKVRNQNREFRFLKMCLADPQIASFTPLARAIHKDCQADHHDE